MGYSMAELSSKAVSAVMEKDKDLFAEISYSIWSVPELAFQEHHAHDVLTEALGSRGFSVQKNYILPTAFRAEFVGPRGLSSPTVAVMCEYDALPNIGHACGHNLIAEVGIAVAFALKAALECDHSLPGKVVVLGTPGEENGCGKQLLIDAGAFHDVNFAVIAHPALDNRRMGLTTAARKITARFQGTPAHAATTPWCGANAINAVVLCYTSLQMLRQHIKPTWSLQANIIKGGEAINIVPANSELQIVVRARETRDLIEFQRKIMACCQGAALATGCQETVDFEDPYYKHTIPNETFAAQFAKHAERMGVSFSSPLTLASSDVGNVSHVVPVIQPGFAIPSPTANHTEGFAAAAGQPQAQPSTITTAHALALAVLDVLHDPNLLDAIREDFRLRVAEQEP